MLLEGYYVVGIGDENPRFLYAEPIKNTWVKGWGEIGMACRFLMFEDALREAKKANPQARVWSVRVSAYKEE